MANRSQMQFVLPLERRMTYLPVTQASPELVQALADLLLEALGEVVSPATSGRDTRDESENHV